MKPVACYQYKLTRALAVVTAQVLFSFMIYPITEETYQKALQGHNIMVQ